jgi:hypothetical protein
MRGHFMLNNRLLVEDSFNLELLIAFEILCTCNNDGKNNILECIGYKFL